MNSVLVEFEEDGYKAVTSAYAVRKKTPAAIAQTEEHSPCKRDVAGSTPACGSFKAEERG